ncbi:MAG: hypothetical protein ACO1QR_12575 [Chthoniobacteraceae bacterium]
MKATKLLWCAVLLVAQSSVLAERPPLQRLPSTIGKPAPEVVAIVGAKLKGWEQEPADLQGAEGSVVFKREGTSLVVLFKKGKVTGAAISGNTTDATFEAAEKEIREALRVASEVVRTAQPDATASDAIAARQKEHFDALVKEGFTRAEAVQIVAASHAAAPSRVK